MCKLKYSSMVQNNWFISQVILSWLSFRKEWSLNIDSQKHEIIKTITVGNRPEYVKLTPDERFAYVTNLGSGTVSKVDVNTLEVVDEIPIGATKGPHGIAFSPNGDLMYISNMNGNDISVIDTSANEIVASIDSGGIEPHQIVMRDPPVSISSR